MYLCICHNVTVEEFVENIPLLKNSEEKLKDCRLNKVGTSCGLCVQSVCEILKSQESPIAQVRIEQKEDIFSGTYQK